MKLLIEGRYEYDPETDRLGGGRFSDVYLACNLRPDDQIPVLVVLKVFKRSFSEIPGADKRFRAEVNAMRRVSHDYIVRIYGYGLNQAGDRYYIVMGYVKGKDLAGVLEDGALPWENVRLILGCVASALSYLHDQGVIHGDVKPSNIIVNPTLDFGCLVDLGVARMVGYQNIRETHTEGLPPGTLHYMAPELWEGEGDRFATDLYALAATTFEMLTGRKLVQVETGSEFKAPPLAAFYQAHCQRAPDLDLLDASGARPWIRDVLSRALDKIPENRGTVQDFYDALLAPDRHPHAHPLGSWGLHGVPGCEVLSEGRWETLAAVGAIHTLLVAGVYTYAGTDVGLVQWYKSEPSLMTVAEGLPHPDVRALAMDRRGWVWIGTGAGLCTGNQPPFKVMPEFEGVEIRDLGVDRDGTLWAATDQGLAHFDDRGNVLAWLRAPEHLPDNDVRCLGIRTAFPQQIWAGCRGGAVCVDALYGRRIFTSEEALDFPAGSVEALAITRDRVVWAATDRDLAFYSQGRWTQLDISQHLSGGTLRAIAPDGSGDVWLAVSSALCQYDHRTRQVSAVSRMPDAEISTLVPRADGSVRVAAGGRVFDVRPQLKERRPSLRLPAAPLGNDLRVLATDGEHTLWLGSASGLTTRRSGRWRYAPIRRAGGGRASPGEGPVLDLAYAPYDDSLWVVTRRGGLAFRRKGRWYRVTFESLTVGRVRAVLAARDGRVWVGADDGLWVIDGARGAPRRVRGLDEGVCCIVEGRDRLWVGTQMAGVWSCRPQRASPTSGVRDWRGEGLVAYEINALYTTVDGAIWAGTGDGAARYGGQGWQPLLELQGYDVLTIFQARDRALWFGSSAHGAARFDGQDLFWLRAGHRLPGEAVRDITQTPDGDLWLATSAGLARFAPFDGD
jgi:ligand-binding sensor domain-containing protein